MHSQPLHSVNSSVTMQLITTAENWFLSTRNALRSGGVSHRSFVVGVGDADDRWTLNYTLHLATLLTSRGRIETKPVISPAGTRA